MHKRIMTRRNVAAGALAVLGTSRALAASSGVQPLLKFDVVADCMKNPEGPVWMKDGR